MLRLSVDKGGMGKDDKLERNSYSKNNGNLELDAARTSVIPHGFTVMFGADLVNTEYAVFNEVHGHQIFDASLAAGLSETEGQGIYPPRHEWEHQSTHILTNATRVNARYAAFNVVGGNQVWKYPAPG